MRTTQERLSESYCRPKTDEEWRLLANYFTQEVLFYGSVDAWQKDFEKCGYAYFFKHFSEGLSYAEHPILGRTEIPVSHVLDLLNDRIKTWRLEEDGFICDDNEMSISTLRLDKQGCDIAVDFYYDGTVKVYLDYGTAEIHTTANTYTKLIQVTELIV